MLFLVIVESMSGGRHFVADVALKGGVDMVGLNVAGHVVAPRVGVRADGAGRVEAAGGHVRLHKPVQLLYAGHQH